MGGIAEIREQLQGLNLEAAEHAAVMLAQREDQPSEVRGEAWLLAAQAAARWGDSDKANQYIRAALATVPEDSQICRQAAIYMGNVALHVQAWDAAEQTFLEFLSRYPAAQDLRPFAMVGLAQVYEGQVRWGLSASAYLQAANAFDAAGEVVRALAARNNAIWVMLLGRDLHNARVLMLQQAQVLESAWPGSKKEQLLHQLAAMTAYGRYLVGQLIDTTDLTSTLMASAGPSDWSICLCAVLGAKLFMQAGDSEQVVASLSLANKYLVRAWHETTGSRSLALLLEEVQREAQQGAHIEKGV